MVTKALTSIILLFAESPARVEGGTGLCGTANPFWRLTMRKQRFALLTHREECFYAYLCHTGSMGILKKILKLAFWISLIITVALFIYRPGLPDQGEILSEIKANEPLQEEAGIEPLNVAIKEYTYMLEPRYRYELYGLVVSLYDADNIFDFTHKNDPGNIKDICVVWGDNIKSGAYKKVKFSSGEFTCFWRWEKSFSPPFSARAGSNSHLIPSNEVTAHLIKDVAIGDQVRIQGYLADYSVRAQDGGALYTRNTSVSRDDTGNGACEIVYVTDMNILKRGEGWLFGRARRIALWGAMVTLVALFGIVISGKGEPNAIRFARI